jgi:hypothetical protein
MIDDADLNAHFESLLAPKPPKPEGEDFFCLTVPLADAGHDWGICATLVGDWETLCGHFDLKNLPLGAKLLQGAEARCHLKRAAKDEARYRAERRFKARAGGRN